MSPKLDLVYVKENEMLMKFYLYKIQDCMDDFACCYEALRIMSQSKEEDISKNDLWDSLTLLCRSSAQLARIFDPQPRKDKDELNAVRIREKIEFSKKRGQNLLALFELELAKNEFDKLRKPRNRLTHFDEDIDNWFFDSKNSSSRQITWRTFDEIHHGNKQCVMQKYDHTNGLLENFGEKYSINELIKIIKSIGERLKAVEKKLSNICPSGTSVTII